MRVISWNLLHGQKIPPTNSQDWQAEVVSAAKKVADELQPNFIALQEVDYFQSRSDFSIDKNPKASYGIALATNWPIKKLYVKKLGRSIIGMPLLIPKDDGKGVRFIYVKDEPRVALIAELENGYTIATTHLSFVPGVNVFQLNKLSSYLKKLPGLALLTGDLNLPANLPSKFSGFKSLISQATYPSWKPKIQFDYIMLRKSELKRISSIKPIKSTATGISDHTPIGVEIQI
jgi:endonuclease/exonuclease/phosphatase family metal-dependent hydrolase